jgi:capsular polysaccharide biosynthesis protein
MKIKYSYKLSKPINYFEGCGFANDIKDKIEYENSSFKKKRFRFLDYYFNVSEKNNLIFNLRCLFKTILFKNRLSIHKSIIIITNNYYKNYFHWINDILPKLTVIENNMFTNIPILIPNDEFIPNFVVESIEILRLNTIRISKNDLFFLKTIFYINQASKTGTLNFNLFNPILKKLLKITKPADQLLKIFITRQNTSTRRTLPFGQLEAFLKANNYLIIDSASFSFHEQINMFSSCSHLIGVHGAGLTNMIFMPQKSKILEIRRKDDLDNYCFFYMSNAINHDYYFHDVNGINVTNNFQEDDLLLDIEKFKEVFKQFNQ